MGTCGYSKIPGTWKESLFWLMSTTTQIVLWVYDFTHWPKWSSHSVLWTFSNARKPVWVTILGIEWDQLLWITYTLVQNMFGHLYINLCSMLYQCLLIFITCMLGIIHYTVEKQILPQLQFQVIFSLLAGSAL